MASPDKYQKLYEAIEAGETGTVEGYLEDGFPVNHVYTKRHGQTPLHQGTVLGKIEIVKLLLRHGANVNAQTDYLETPLHLAAHDGEVEIVKILLEHGAKLDVRNKHDETPLQMAFKNDSIETIKVLIDKGANLASKDKHNMTLLHWASHYGRRELVELLLGVSEVDVNDCDVNGWTPLFEAACHTKTDVMEMLLKKNACVNSQDKMGWTTLHYASASSKEEVMRILLNHKADTSIRDKKNETAMHKAFTNNKWDAVKILLKFSVSVDDKDTEGRTLLHRSSLYCNKEIVKSLLDKGSDIDSVDKKGWTALHYAVHNGESEAVKLLLEKGAVVNITDDEGCSPLHRASVYGNEDIVQMLLSNDANISDYDKKGWTSLHYAASSDKLNVVKILAAQMVDVDIADRDGVTPLHIAAKRGYPAIVRELLTRGADIDLKSTALGWTSLHFAASSDKLNVVNILAAQMVDVDIADRDGVTPLHIAAKRGYPAIVRELLTRGADIDLKSTALNKTPYEIAEELGRSDVVAVFEEFLADGLPLEIKLLDSERADEFERCLRSGFYYSYCGKLMFVGNESVGKTAIARLILGKKPKTKRKPTEGIDIHVNKAVIDRKSRKLIPKAMKFEDIAYSNLFMRKKDGVKQMNPCPHTDVLQDDIIDRTVDADENQDHRSYCYEIPEDQEDLEASVSSDDRPIKNPIERASSFKELFLPTKKTQREHRAFSKKLFRAGAKRAGLKGIHKMRLAPIIILDFAGQEVFYSTHQSFLTHRGVYVIVINGSLNLDAKIESEKFIPGRQGPPTTREYIKFWVNSILCYCRGRSQDFPKIIICCTHKDRIEEIKFPRQKEYIFDEIDKMFNSSSASSHLVTGHRIFLNAIDPKDPGIEILKNVIVDMILSQPTWGEKMPKSWIYLEMGINQKAKEGEKVLKLQKIRKINQLNPIKPLDESEMNLFLQFHHSVGNILYFPLPGLRDHVIISPSFLIDALKMIVTDKRFVKDKRLDMWRCLNSEGKLQKNDLMKMFGNHADFAEYKDFLINLMCHQDILTEPRVYHPEKGCIIRSDFFYVPSMVKSESGEIFPDQSVLSNSMGFSFKFNTSILPSAIGFRLIACCLDLWEVCQYKNQNLLFSGVVVVVIDKFERLIVQVKEDRIDIFLTHNTSRFEIKADKATSIRESLTDILKGITDSYKIMSAGTGNRTTSSFQIEYTCFNVFSPCYCQERMEWTCTHGYRITKDILNKWFVDRTIKDVDCPRDCQGINLDALKLQPTELHLAKLSLLLKWENLEAILIHLGIEKNEIEEIEINYKGELSNIRFLCLRKWRMKTPLYTFDKIDKAIKKIEQDPHILCKVFRDRRLETNVAYDILEKDPTDKVLDSIAKGTLERSLLFCVHLGIQANDWLTMKINRF